MGVNQMCATTLLTLDLAQDDQMEGVCINFGDGGGLHFYYALNSNDSTLAGTFLYIYLSAAAVYIITDVMVVFYHRQGLVY